MIIFSIITITKDSGDLLLRTESSLSNQTFKEFEWIIVDNSSSQYSLDIVTKVSARSSARLISGLDRNIAHAWNIGINASIADYIMILNSGDSYDPEFLKLCNSNISPEFILCGTPLIVDSAGNSVGSFSNRPKSLWRGMHLAHNWMCIPRHFYSNHGLYLELPFAMDYEFVRRLFSIYGSELFRLLPTTGNHGMYFLGGLSDKHYFKSLVASLDINIKYYHMCNLLAFALFLAYAFKRLTSLR